MENQYTPAIGDQVQLKSGGPIMTVNKGPYVSIQKQQCVGCTWFDDKKELKNAGFVAATLKG